jgi:periplasmic protein CpxP/Spy
MKKVFLALLLVISVATFAQEKKRDGKEKQSPDQQVEFILKKMTEELGLSEKQQNEIKPILIEQSKNREEKRAKFRANREKGVKPTDEEIAEMKKSRADEELAMKTKLKTILTEEQYKKWSERSKEIRNKMKDKKADKPSENK